MAVGLRLGVNLCQPHECPCGTIADSRGTHGLSCRRSSGRIARHHHINDIVWRGLSRASIPCSKVPSGLSRTDGKRPDGLTLIPWQGGKSLIWDVTVADTLAASHLPHSSRTAKGAADKAAEKKKTSTKLSKLTTFSSRSLVKPWVQLTSRLSIFSASSADVSQWQQATTVREDFCSSDYP